MNDGLDTSPVHGSGERIENMDSHAKDYFQELALDEGSSLNLFFNKTIFNVCRENMHFESFSAI